MTATYEGWAILEIMGHRVRAGWIREVEIAGGKMLQIDIPVGKDDVGQDIKVSEFYGAGAIYSLRPCSEEIVRDEMKRYGGDPRPVRPLEYREREAPKALPHDGASADDDDEKEMPF